MDINRQTILRFLVCFAGLLITAFGLYSPIGSYAGVVSNALFGGTGFWFAVLIILGVVLLFSRRYKGVLFIAICVALLFLKVISPVWTSPDMMSLKWGAVMVAAGLLLIFGDAFYWRNASADVASAGIKANYVWPLFAVAAFMIAVFVISLSGGGAAYLLQCVAFPFLHFLKLEAALRISWIPVLLLPVGLTFYYLGALSVDSLYRNVSEPELSRICGTFIGFVVLINVTPSVAGKISNRVVSSQVSNIVFPDATNSDACRNTIAYVKRIPGGSEIWSMDEYGHNNINLSAKYSSRGTGRPFDSHPHWSPDGKKIVFSAERNGAPGVYLMSCDGAIQYMVTATRSNNNYPGWMPDGEHILYSDIGLSIVEYTGKNPETLLQGGSLGAAVSPDGKQIASVNITGPHTSNIELINIESGEKRVLVSDGNYNIWPKWIDGSWLSYATDLGKHKLYPPIEYKKKAPYVPRYYSMTSNASYETLPDSVASVEGKFTLASKEIDGKAHIAVVDAAGKVIRQLTSEGWNYSPDLKPGTILSN